MIRILPLLAQVHALLLRLYPREFRDEFGDEMRSVFSDSLADAAKHGTLALIPLCLRELRDLPGAVLQAHWHRRSNALMENKPRVRWFELLGPAIPFLLYLALPIADGLSFLRFYWGGVVILPILGALIILLGGLIILLIAGLFKGMPRWSLPALGLSLAVLNGLSFGLEDPVFRALPSFRSPFLRGMIGAGIPLAGITVLTSLLLLASATIKPLRPFFHRIHSDWTLLPFALYGTMPLVMWLSFDDYQGDAPYQIGMGAILLASLWLYLRTAQPMLKLLMLGSGITLAMAVEAFGKWMLVPSQNWSVWFEWHTVAGATELEVMSTVYTWFWAMVVVFLPALLGILPHSSRSSTATQP